MLFIISRTDISLFILNGIAGREIVDEAENVNVENQHRVTDIETETAAKTKKRNVNENVKDCPRLRKNI